MCAINGIFAYHDAANTVNRAELMKTREHMAARGPDGKGEWVSSDKRVGFGHRRLSIIDLSENGAQPMANAGGTLIVTFNGEIYNYRELRLRLEAKSYVFRSNSDTEVLLHLYADKGEAMVDELRGMFAFAIWDLQKREMFLARDPYGIKPLYFADDCLTFRFASQVKALVASEVISRDPEPAGVVGFYLWGSVPEPFTLYKAIRSLPAGSWMRVGRNGANTPVNYHSIAQVFVDAERAALGRNPIRQSEAILEVRGALLESVRQHLVADVPVGAFLSAGIDSSALVGLMRDAGQMEIQTVTLTFEEFRGKRQDEAPLAEVVARNFGTHHTTRLVGVREFKDDLPHILEAMDQPSIDGINTWFVSKSARELGLKVAISGLGGDELFGGYPSFRDIPRWVSLLRVSARVPKLGTFVRRALVRTGLGIASNPKAAGMLELGGSFAGAYLLKRGMYMPWELEELLDRDTIRHGLTELDPIGRVESALVPLPENDFGKIAALESMHYMRNQLLRDADWASMAQGLEIRLPLVDATLLRAVAPHVAKKERMGGKALLATAPSRALPSDILNRSKTGFEIPTGAWTGEYHKVNGLSSRAWSRAVMAGFAS